MKGSKMIGAVLAMVGFVVSAQTAVATTTWNIKNDWSDVNNPNGPWSLRFGNGNLLTSTHMGGGWSTPQASWGSIPGCWFKSNGTETVSHDWLAGDIVTHTSDSSNPSYAMVIRWTSPIDGVIDVSGNAWWGGVPDQFYRANDWSVKLDNVSLTGGVGTIGSGSGRGRSNPIDFSKEGSGGSKALTGLSVHVGDTVDLDISMNSGSYQGWGAYSGENFIITAEQPVPEPLTLTALGMGIAGLGGYLRRRKAAR